MSMQNRLPENDLKPCILFDDDTDLAALGFSTEAHDWRLPANLPARPQGLALGVRSEPIEWLEQEVAILQYQPDWRVWIVPTLSFGLMLSCLGLISMRLELASGVLIGLAIAILLMLVYTAQLLRQQRLSVDRHGISYAASTAHRIRWHDLVGIASERCFAGRTLIFMSRQGVDHSIRIAYLPAQQASQLVRLLRSQLARQAQT